MATETKFRKQRLFKVSRELNVSVDTILDHLKHAGFDKALSGTGLNAAIVDEEAYESLLAEYAEDRAAAARVHKKRVERDQAEEEGRVEPDLVAESDFAAAVAEVEEVAAEPEPVVLEEPELVQDEVPEPPVDVEEVLDIESDLAVVVEPKPEAEAPVVVEEAAAEPAAEPEPEVAAVEAEAEAEAIAPEAEKEVPETSPDGAEPDDKAAEDETSDTIRAGRYALAGTKVLGKIDLPAAEDPGETGRKRRKRKRKKAEASTKEGSVVISDDASRDVRGRRKAKKRSAVDEQAVEKTLQETLRELEQGASRVRQRRRKERREARAAERLREEEQAEEASRVLRVTEYVSTGELANLMDVPVNEVISILFGAGMMVSINQRLDADTITFVAHECGFDLEFITEYASDDILIEEDEEEDLQSRAPVVTVMGHVDHGKTSLLDYVRSASVVAGEAGGITQHIGAYHVELPSGRNITFLDTPGHEAFTAMRARGAKVTDVVILVVAADDSVMPQTVEAINHARAADVPLVVAVNKIDKPDANPQRVMQGLTEHNVLVEQFGGKVQCALVSAKSGEGIEDLLEKVLLEADLLELKANPDRNALGTVIESRLDKGRGVVSTILVLNGTLRVGDTFVAGIYAGRVRAMFDEREKRVAEIGPSKPAMVLGFDGSPEVGDQFIVLDDERETRDIAQRRQQIYREQSLRQRKHITLDEIGRRLALGEFRELSLIVKADVGGSVEALSDALLKLSTEEVAVNIIHTGVGAITESDVHLASASDAVIIGFQVRPMPTARHLAEREEIDVRTYSIIYDAIANVRDALEGLLSPEKSENTLGVAEVRELFKIPKVGTIAGCYVIDGKIKRNDRIRLIREGVVIYQGSLSSLKRFKDDAREVQSGYECGIGMENYDDLKVGDQFEAFEIVETKRKLEV